MLSLASRSFVALSPLLRRCGSDDHLARVPTFLRFAFRFTLFALHSIVVGPLVVGGYPHNAAYDTEKRGEGGSILVMKLKKRERKGEKEGERKEIKRREAGEWRKREGRGRKKEKKRERGVPRASIMGPWPLRRCAWLTHEGPAIGSPPFYWRGKKKTVVSRARPSRAGMYLHRKVEISYLPWETEFPSRIVGGPCQTLWECGCVRVAITNFVLSFYIILCSVRACKLIWVSDSNLLDLRLIWELEDSWYLYIETCEINQKLELVGKVVKFLNEKMKFEVLDCKLVAYESWWITSSMNSGLRILAIVVSIVTQSFQHIRR